MTQTIKLFATLRDVAQAKSIQLDIRDGQTVREMIASIRVKHPALAEMIVTPDGELTGLVHILVHGRHIQWLDGLDTTMKTTDSIVLMPPTAGG